MPTAAVFVAWAPSSESPIRWTLNSINTVAKPLFDHVSGILGDLGYT